MWSIGKCPLSSGIVSTIVWFLDSNISMCLYSAYKQLMYIIILVHCCLCFMKNTAQDKMECYTSRLRQPLIFFMSWSTFVHKIQFHNFGSRKLLQIWRFISKFYPPTPWFNFVGASLTEPFTNECFVLSTIHIKLWIKIKALDGSIGQLLGCFFIGFCF